MQICILCCELQLLLLCCCCLLTPAGELSLTQRQQVQRCQQLQRLQVAARCGQQALARSQLAARCSLRQRVPFGTDDLEEDIMLMNSLCKLMNDAATQAS